MFGGYCANKIYRFGEGAGLTLGHFSSPLTCRTFRVSA
jgi:hypothetical protein